MTADSAGPRVLAVDDLEPIRMLIDRVLSSSGYQVDVAGSLAEARSMNPAGYDVLLVDASLGDEMGTDLIRELVSADPAAAGRCLLVSGGGMAETLPGVGCLAKPFGPEALVHAVRALHETDTASRPPPAQAVRDRPAPGTPAGGGPGPTLAGPCAAILAQTRQLRAAERATIADFIHDGPMQELTCALLTLRMAAGPAPAELAAQLGELQHRLDVAGRSLRQLTGGSALRLAPAGDGAGLAGAIRQRCLWLPLAEVSVGTEPAEAADGVPSGLVPLIADVAELALGTLTRHLPASRAGVLVRTGADTAAIELELSPGNGTAAGPADLVAAEEQLTELARALGGTALATRAGPGWRAQLTVPLV